MTTQKDVIFSTENGRDLKMDIYLPDGQELTHTAILLLHGGGWRFGDKSMMDIFGPELAGHGFVALASEYRLIGETPWPAQIEDVKAAIRWTKANAGSLGIDPEKVVVQGFSAGGHLALMAGGSPGRPELSGKGDIAVSDAVAAVVAFFPPIEFAVNPSQPGCNRAAALLGESATEEAAEKASPINYVTKDFPPTFLLHGTADATVSYLTSQRMFDALIKNGVMAELHLYPGHIHEFVRLPSMMARTQAEIALFVQRTVVDPEKYIRENEELNMFSNRAH